MEKIICSAILRNVFPRRTERFDWTEHSTKHIPILCKRHWDGIWLKAQLYWEKTTQEQQWFWTNRNRFVSREEAFKIAKKAGQLKTINQIDWEPIDYTNETLLYSEYVW